MGLARPYQSMTQKGFLISGPLLDLTIAATITQGQVSAEGILHLANPNLGSNSGMRIFESRILGPNAGVRIFESAKKAVPAECSSKIAFRIRPGNLKVLLADGRVRRGVEGERLPSGTWGQTHIWSAQYFRFREEKSRISKTVVCQRPWVYPYPRVSDFAGRNSDHGPSKTQTKTQTTPDSVFIGARRNSDHGLSFWEGKTQTMV